MENRLKDIARIAVGALHDDGWYDHSDPLTEADLEAIAEGVVRRIAERGFFPTRSETD
jgi:hypothetical protein